ncbi:hypothetical protein [Flectobacillus roseus]|uniref:Lipoprotein n=1 Tax=Flectobacillus roseus TaxID=502259 RepID=A0ABT6Y3C3_9BACT|nr:hypothetical protein [Flectobacillus roseus]MDI9858065.1 hypothetical protein [Flectobacillus roseus]
MITLRNLLLSIFFIGLIACNTKTSNLKTEVKKVTLIKNLAGKVYFFAPDLDTTTCEAFGACDCCTSNILFLNNKDFVTISYCVTDQQIAKGTYHIDNDKVYLQYDSLKVDIEYNMETETDTTGKVEPEYFIRTQKREANKVVLTALTCKGQVNFKAGDKEISYGSLDKKTPIEDHIQQLKSLGIWYKLK